MTLFLKAFLLLIATSMAFAGGNIPFMFLPISENSSGLLNAVFLSHFDGADNGTTFTDQYGATISSVGSAVTSTTQKKFGTSALYLSQSSLMYLTVPDSNNWFFDTGDFTIEFWAYPTSSANQGYILSQSFGEGGTDMAPVGISYTTAQKFQIAYGQNGVSPWNAYVPCSNTSALNTWHHVVAVRSGTDFKLYVNGTNCATITLPGGFSFQNSTTTLRIGYFNSSYSSYSFVGYLDELLIIKGRAAYTADFTPPTAPY